jgi:hypothetical protein
MTGSASGASTRMRDPFAVGKRVKFATERLRYTVQARDERYLVCTKPFNLQRTVLYCIVDLAERQRGPHNLIFNPYALETREGCEECLRALQSGKCKLSRRHSKALDLEVPTAPP